MWRGVTRKVLGESLSVRFRSLDFYLSESSESSESSALAAAYILEEIIPTHTIGPAVTGINPLVR